ncbi:MAG TPA: sulfatase-like hydrolase/transferase [Planctomycetota bacterium]|nr:sulfatase-like hydrolase/transferase [Planctomycetota bacterium]
MGFACGGEGSGEAPQGPISALLITLDTTRADALGCYGGREGVTPHLDALAREAVLYERARTTAPITLPAHASMLTGLTPVRSSVRDNSLNPLSAEAVTLAERARARGFATAAVVSAAVLDAAFGLDQGFEVYIDPVRDFRTGIHTTYFETSSEDTAKRVVTLLRGRKDSAQPFFVWMHLFSPHVPYEPPARFAHIGDPYLGEVAYADEAVGRVLDELRAQGLYERTAILVVGDHGEGLGEHGEDTHSLYCYDSTMRVPFLLRRPDGRRAGERSQETVSVVDVYPTLLAAMGLGEPGAVDGFDLWNGRVPHGREAFFESYYGFLHYNCSPISGAADAEAKYIHGQPPELFLSADAKEAANVAGARPELVQRYRSALQRLDAQPALEAVGDIDPSLLGSLQSLGYATALGGGEIPGLVEDTGLVAPRAAYAEYLEIERARRHSGLGELDQAVAVLREVVAKRPGNTAAASDLATYLIASEHCDEAEDILRDLIAAGSQRAETYLNLGYCLQLAHRDEEAVAAFQRVLELDPGSSTAIFNLTVVLRRLGREAEAAAYQQRLRKQMGR